MPQFTVKYADARGEIRQETAESSSAQELRDRYVQQGYLVYHVRGRGELRLAGLGRRPKKLNLEKFLIFNQQFVTLIRAGLPILKALDLLAERLTEPKLGRHVLAVRDDVRNGTLLSEAFRKQGVFPPMYVTSVMAGEKSGALGEVLERYIAYQRLSLAVRKKILLSLLYPAVLISLVVCLIVFLVTYVVPNFAELYRSMSADLPVITQVLVAVGTTARNYVVAGFLALVAAIIAFRYWARRESAKEKIDRVKLHTPILGEIWIKFQVAQLGRVLSTLLQGGIPLVQALETACNSIGTAVLRKALEHSRKMVKEGQALSAALSATGVFPGLAIDMIEVGESTGALPACWPVWPSSTRTT